MESSTETVWLRYAKSRLALVSSLSWGSPVALGLVISTRALHPLPRVNRVGATWVLLEGQSQQRAKECHDARVKGGERCPQ